MVVETWGFQSEESMANTHIYFLSPLLGQELGQQPPYLRFFVLSVTRPGKFYLDLSFEKEF